MLLLEEVARRIKDLEAVVCGGDVTALTLDTLDRISKASILIHLDFLSI